MSKCEVAIVGASCRFPGDVYDLHSFWNLLKEGKNAVKSGEASKIIATERFYHPNRNMPGRSVTFSAGWIEAPDSFDAEFFGISPKEVESMDPHQRQLLELSWEAFEDAGIQPSTVKGKNIGVFMAAGNFDASLRSADDPALLSSFSMLGTSMALLSNRISYQFDLKGPSFTVDTACSSALVALHQACRAMHDQNLPMALVGGVHVIKSPHMFIGFSKAGMLSEDGLCRAFDAHGKGFVRGEGGGVVVLKNLKDAIRDGDRIHAVIRASGINTNGLNASVAMPDEDAQAELLRSIYRDDGVDAKRLAYIEAHGTGTAVGDPIEARAIGRAIPPEKRGRLWIGSVKTNIGHLEVSSGMAGLLKAILVLKHRQVPKNLHFSTPNPDIDFDGLALSVPIKLEPLPSTDGLALVGVNSFGFGGSNAHVVLEEAKAPELPDSPAPAEESDDGGMIALSARSRESLGKLAIAYGRFLERNPALPVRDVAAAAIARREPLTHRLVISGGARKELIANLGTGCVESVLGKWDKIEGEAMAGEPRTAFVFSGNGSVWPNMGRELVKSIPVFAASVRELDDLLAAKLGWSLVDALSNPLPAEELENIEKAQPLLLAMQVGLVNVLAENGIVPDMVYGHSFGEITAAWAAGAISLREAAEITYYRSSLQGESKGLGSMAAVGISADTAAEWIADIDPELEVSAVNAPKNVTLVGSVASLQKVRARAKKKRCFFSQLNVPYPFHSKAMLGFQKRFIASALRLKPGKARIPFISTVTGEILDGARLNKEYWWNNIAKPVNFLGATETAVEQGARLFMEIGPNRTLDLYIRETSRIRSIPMTVLPTMLKGDKTELQVEASWKTAWVSGWPVRWDKHFSGMPRHVDLPLYQWNKENCRKDPTPESAEVITAREDHPLLGIRRKGLETSWENCFDAVLKPWLADHRIGGKVIYPGTAFVEMALAVAKRRLGTPIIALENMSIGQALEFPEEGMRVLETRVDDEDSFFSVSSRKYLSNEQWLFHAQGRMYGEPSMPGVKTYEELAVNPASFGSEVDIAQLYEANARVGLHYGESFRTVRQGWINGKAALARLRTDYSGWLEKDDQYVMPPQLLDGAFHLTTPIRLELGFPGTYLPYQIEKVRFIAGGARPEFARTTITRISDYSMTVDLVLFDARGRVVMLVDGCRFMATNAFAGLATSRLSTLLEPMFLPRENAECGMGKEWWARELAESARCFPPPGEEIGSRTVDFHRALLASVRAALIRIFPHTGLRVVELAVRFELKPWEVSYFSFLLEELANAGEANDENGIWRLNDESRLPSHEEAFEKFVAEYPGAVEDARLLVKLDAYLKSRLSGAAPAAWTDSASRNQLLFSSDPAILGLDAAIVALVGKFVHDMKGASKLRVLLAGSEIARLGKALAAAVRDKPVELIIAHANGEELEEIRSKIGSSPNCRFETMSLDGGGAIPGGVDVMILSHLLHDMKNPELGLAHAGAILAPGGALIATERDPGAIYDIVSGVRTDWWELSQDPELPVSRLRDVDEWKAVLADAGFESVGAGIAVSAGADRGAHLLVAHNNRPSRGEESRKPAEDGAWLLASDGAATSAAAGVWSAVKNEWKERGRALTSVAADGKSVFDPFTAESWERVFSKLKSRQKLNLLFGVGFDTDRNSADTPELLESRAVAAAMMAKGWIEAGKPPLRVWLLNGGGAPFLAEGCRPVPSQGSLWGLGRTLMNEMAGMDVRLVDFHGENPGSPEAAVLSRLADEVEAGSPEREMIVVKDAVFVPRVSLADDAAFYADSASGGEFLLALPVEKKIRSLHWAGRKTSPVKADEVKVEVGAVGLNYRDTMWASGLLPEQALENGFSGPTLGLEGAGVVVEAGSEAMDVRPGDRVMFFAPQSFASHVTTSGHAVVRIPDGMPFAGAATMPVAFSTAWYAMSHLARLKAGESILIHGAAGGVGLAAIQIGKALGLDIFATAGSEEKREFLRSLGIDKVMDSRTLVFGDQVMDWTNGRGVDAVLNSIAGRAATRSLDCLAPFGRFLELGKRDFYADSAMRLYPFRNNISYFGIDLDQLIARDRELAGAIISQISAMIGEGRLRPLPYTVFPADQVVDAYTDMRRSQHIGKIVVDLECRPSAVKTPRSECAAPDSRLRGDAAYLVVGGASGFGLATAKFLVEKGARHLVLLSRRGGSAELEAVLPEWANAGVDVACVAADAANAAELSAKLDAALKGRPALRGIVHAAAVLDDGVIANMTAGRMRKVIGAKAKGAWNLHNHSLGLELDFFLLYSSITTMVGNPGQASYVSANTALESLAVYRRSLGLPGVAIGWGAIAGTGMLARSPEVLASLAKGVGIQAVTAGEALGELDEALSGGEPVVSMVKMRWNRLRSVPIAATPLYSRMNLGAEESAGGRPLWHIVSGLSLEKALEEIRKYLVEQLASIMQLSAKRIPLDKPLMNMGIDSLMIVELSMLIEEALEKPIPAGFLNPSLTVRDLSEKLYIDLCASKDVKAGSRDDLSSLKTLVRRHGAALPEFEVARLDATQETT